jgi:cbb3-type cytochrome oxidase subunit 3
MYLPKPLYEAKPYLYVLTGVLVAVTWGFSPFSVISSAALIIGGAFILYLRFVYRRKARAAQESSAATETPEATTEKTTEDQPS